MEWSTKTVLSYLTDRAKAELDNLVIIFKNNDRQKHKQTLTKLSFSSGFINMSNVQASDIPYSLVKYLSKLWRIFFIKVD